MRRIRTSLGVGLGALAIAAPGAGAATLVSPANGAVVTTKTTQLTWALDPATAETTTGALDASYPDIFEPGAGFNIRDESGVWTDVHPFLQPTQTTVTTKPLFAGMHHWGVMTTYPAADTGQPVNVQSAVGTFSVKPKVLGKGLKIVVSRTRSAASLDWAYLHNVPRYTFTWTLKRNGNVIASDTTRYRSSERTIYTWLDRDETVGRNRGYFNDGDRLKLTIKFTSRTEGVKISKTFSKSITVD